MVASVARPQDRRPPDLLGPAFEQLLTEIELQRRQRLWPDGARLCRAFLLAPGDRTGLDVCSALLRNENVPLARLDIRWVQRYGLERIAA